MWQNRICMKKYLLFFMVCMNSCINATGTTDKENPAYFPLQKPWKEGAKQKKTKSLKRLCVRTILKNPRAYIGADSKLNNEVKEYILDICLTDKMQLHFGFATEDINIASQCISQVLLMKACYKTLKKAYLSKKLQKIQLNIQEKDILSEMPLTIQQNMSHYLEIKKS